MKDIFDRIGVYDFFGICGAGALHIIYFLLTKFYIENNSIYEITKQISAYDSILLFLMFFILSYFVGTILHELGKFLMENIFKSFTISTIRKTINSDKFNTEENFIKTLNPLNKMRKDFKAQTETLNPDIPLHKALSYFKHKGNSILLDKYHSLYGLSRGIWIGCILNMAIIAIAYIDITINSDASSITMALSNIRIRHVLFLDLILIILFYCRSYRFYLIWVKNVFTQYNLCTKPSRKRGLKNAQFNKTTKTNI